MSCFPARHLVLPLALLLPALGCPGSGEDGEEDSGADEVGPQTEDEDTSSEASSDTETSSDTDTAADTEDTGSETGAACDPAALLDGLSLDETYLDVDYGWAKVERWVDANPGFEQEAFFPDARSEQKAQRLEFFAFDPTPHSSELLLYYAPNFEAALASGRTPVVLAHGANDNADRAWSDPGESGDFGCGKPECPNEGLMQALVAAGYPVVAVTMAHSQGDNYYWAEQIHNAIDIVRAQTCELDEPAAQVDLIGWSKGAFAARMYVSGVREDWGRAYADDVRKLVLIGGPNLGFDYLFRYGTAHNLGVWPPNGTIHAPVAHDAQVVGLSTIDLSEYAVYETAAGDYFRGQRQMVDMWIDEYPLTAVANNGFGDYAIADSLATYWGEGDYTGLLARGKGIEFTIAQGSLVQTIVEAGTPASVETFLLCSELTSPDSYIPGIPNEIAGPSDGVVFVESCASAEGIGKLGQVAILEDVNHLELGWSDLSIETITGWLGQ